MKTFEEAMESILMTRVPVPHPNQIPEIPAGMEDRFRKYLPMLQEVGNHVMTQIYVSNIGNTMAHRGDDMEKIAKHMFAMGVAVGVEMEKSEVTNMLASRESA